MRASGTGTSRIEAIGPASSDDAWGRLGWCARLPPSEQAPRATAQATSIDAITIRRIPPRTSFMASPSSMHLWLSVRTEVSDRPFHRLRRPGAATSFSLGAAGLARRRHAGGRWERRTMRSPGSHRWAHRHDPVRRAGCCCRSRPQRPTRPSLGSQGIPVIRRVSGASGSPQRLLLRIGRPSTKVGPQATRFRNVL